jgi:hypothetical protein
MLLEAGLNVTVILYYTVLRSGTPQQSLTTLESLQEAAS